MCISLWNCFNIFLWEEIVLNLLDVCCTLALSEKDTQWRSHSRNFEFRISYSSFPRRRCGSRKANRSSHHWIDQFILKWNLATILCWSILEISKPESIHTDYLTRVCFVFVFLSGKSSTDRRVAALPKSLWDRWVCPPLQLEKNLHLQKLAVPLHCSQVRETEKTNVWLRLWSLPLNIF